MKNILRKSISCCLLLCCLLTACGTQAESPDTIEDILNPNRKKQETETTTEYHGIFFQPETEIQMEVSETTSLPETETVFIQTEIIPTETEFLETETILTEEPPETAPVQIETTAIMTTTVQTVTEVMTETQTVEMTSTGWEEAYREFLESKRFQSQISADVQEADTKFLLLYLNNDDIPELFIQTTMEVLIYAYHNNRVVYVDNFYPSHYTYVFYYRPYHNCLGSMQGSVMADGTYLEIYEFVDSELTDSGLALKETYCYPTREFSYEIYAERGMNIDLDKAPELDVYPDRQNNIGSSWITVPDVLENSSSIQRYGMTEEELNTVFGEKESDVIEETEESQGGRYAFR